MKKTLIITESQQEKLFEYNLKFKTLITESKKECILGIGLILNKAVNGTKFNQSGHNLELSNKAITNPKIMSKIKNMLEDESQLDELFDAMEILGVKDPKSFMSKNANKLVSTFNSLAKESNIKDRLDITTVLNLNK
jgi:hypothetical protein